MTEATALQLLQAAIEDVDVASLVGVDLRGFRESTATSAGIEGWSNVSGTDALRFFAVRIVSSEVASDGVTDTMTAACELVVVYPLGYDYGASTASAVAASDAALIATAIEGVAGVVVTAVASSYGASARCGFSTVSFNAEFDVTGEEYETVAANTTAITAGRNKAAEINAAISVAAASASASTKGEVTLASGTFYLEAAIELQSYVRLVMQDDTILVPTFTGGADTGSNAAILVVGALDTATLNTTLSATAVKGKASITVTAAGSIAAEDYIVISGTNTTGDSGVMSDGSAVALTELAQVASTYTSGTTLPMAWPLYQNHGGTITVKAVSPVIGAEVVGGYVQGSQGGVTTAAAVYALYALDLQVEGLRASGCSRAAIDVESCKGFRSTGFRNAGGSNGWYFLSSVLDFEVTDFDGPDSVSRSHTSGYPRAQIYLRYRCTDGKIHDGNLRCGYAGLFHAGGVNLTFSNIHIRNQEITQALYDRAVASGEWQSGGLWALGFGSGHGPLTIAEFASNCVYSDITTEDLRAPSGTGWDDTAPYTAVAGYIHDTKAIVATNIGCVNWDNASSVAGVVISDADGALFGLMVRGHSYGLTCQNVLDDVKVNRYRYDAVRGGSPGGSIPIYLNYNSSSQRGVKFDGVHVTNAFSFLRFGGSFAFDALFEIRDLITDQGQWSYVILANNQTGTSFSTGDVVEVDSSYTGTDLRIVTPNTGGTDYSGRLAAVASGGSEDPGTGFLAIAPLPQLRASVKASTAAIAYGDRIGYAATRRAAASSGAAQPIGTARTRKAAGSEGMIVLGPAA